MVRDVFRSSNSQQNALFHHIVWPGLMVEHYAGDATGFGSHAGYQIAVSQNLFLWQKIIFSISMVF